MDVNNKLFISNNRGSHTHFYHSFTAVNNKNFAKQHWHKKKSPRRQITTQKIAKHTQKEIAKTPTANKKSIGSCISPN